MGFKIYNLKWMTKMEHTQFNDTNDVYKMCISIDLFV